MFRLLRFLTGVALLPLCVAATLTLLDILRGLPSTGLFLSQETTWLLTGYFLWLAMWFFMPQPVRAYVVAHELTHAVWGLFFGARVRNLRVTSRGGSVTLSKTNMLITLAPYFFPLYTVIIILLRLLVGLFVTPIPLPFLWLFLVGLSWGFHVCFTIQSLMTEQPDISEYGLLFSCAFIYLFNLAGIGIWVVCTTSATLQTFAALFALHASEAYASVGDEIRTRILYFKDTAWPGLYNLLRRDAHVF